MEESFRVRPCTPRSVERKSDDFSDIHDPIEILQILTGFSPLKLNSLIKLELQIDAETVAVHNFGRICPNVTELKLSGSAIESLRDLGTDWNNLEVLWLVRTGLTEIDGLSAFSKLKELYCAFNSIKNLSALMFHENIQVLDIEGNKLEDWDEVEYLRDCSSLWSVNFEGNPIVKSLDYRQKVFAILEQIMVLDDLDKETVSNNIEENKEIELIHDSVRQSVMPRNKSEMSTRPSTAKNIFQEETSHLTEEVFTGNPIKAMRFRRRKLFQGDGREDIMNLIREFKFEGDGKNSKAAPVKAIPIKNKNIVIRSSRRDEFYETK